MITLPDLVLSVWRTSFAVREMEVKTIVTHYHTLDGMARIKYDNAKCWEGHRTTETFMHCCWEYSKYVQPLWKSWAVSYEVPH